MGNIFSRLTGRTSPPPSPPPPPPPPPPQQEPANTENPPPVVIRRNMRSMTPEQLDRFFAAVDRMMQNTSGPGTSEFFRCASYHGEPSPYYCEHGQETFPGWHRVYLRDFERALQKADVELGGDGQISLPYWDWADEGDAAGLPEVVRERFAGWPEGFWPEELQGLRMTSGLRRASQENIASALRSWGVAAQARDLMFASQHWEVASTRWRGSFPSLETPHNSIHVIVGGNGGQMGSVAWAAYDIAFWLHHCNVDRLYEGYLSAEPDSAEEFRNFQAAQEVNLFEVPFEPFRKPDGTRFSPADTFDIQTLGYAYDALPPIPQGQQLRENPILAVFPSVKTSDFDSRCFQLHVFVHDKDAPPPPFPETVGAIDFSSPHYAGGLGIFGRGAQCKTCVSKPPVDLEVDITAALRALGIEKSRAALVVAAVDTCDESEAVLRLSDTPVPAPVVAGPSFSSSPDGDAGTVPLQQYLAKYGYYAGDIDGDYGPQTEAAVTELQASSCLRQDGVAGPLTRKAIATEKRCDVPEGAELSYLKRSTVTYHVGLQPGYLPREGVLDVLHKACEAFSEVVTFRRVEEEEEADIRFRWTRFEVAGNVLRFDRAGGVLGKGGNGFVDFDYAERWATGLDTTVLSALSDPSTWYKGRPVVSLLAVATHELGHALGLGHSRNPEDLMYPYYNPAATALSRNDKDLLEQIVQRV